MFSPQECTMFSKIFSKNALSVAKGYLSYNKAGITLSKIVATTTCNTPNSTFAPPSLYSLP